MVSADEFWRILASYSAAIEPAQFIFYFVALVIVAWSLLKPGWISSFVLKLFLAIAFAWVGAAFYLTHASDMAGTSHGNLVFAWLFFIVFLLFAADILRDTMQFALPSSSLDSSVTLTLIALVFCYPLFGLLSSHEPRPLLFPGTHPCPTVALGLLMLTMALPRVDRAIYYILLVCAIPFTPIQILKYGVLEDIVLLAAGVFAFLMLHKSKCADPGAA
jgi:hypothetical protein